MPLTRSQCAGLLAGGLLMTALLGFGRSDTPVAAAAAVKTIAPFTLNDTAGKPWTVPDAKAAKAVVVVFTGTACPINASYMPTLAKLHQEFGSNGVAFVAINANAQDDPARLAAFARQHNLPFPVLKDVGNAVADRFGAENTPEAFVLDETRTIKYRGRIDDQFGFDYKRPAPTRRDLAVAIDEVLSGKTVTTPLTAIEGCIIGRVATPKADATVTYSKQVARILQNNCQECHRPGQIGPMPFVTYEDAAAWAPTIRMVVRQGRMPPWHADPKYGHFLNARGLSDEDKQTLFAWVEQGCPQGDAKDLPPAKEYPADEGWRIGKPDHVFTMSDACKVPALAPRGGVPYRYFQVPTNFATDVWVQAAEARPGAKAVVHHIIAYVVPPGQPLQQGDDRVGDHMLVAFAPGDLPSIFEPGYAKKIPKGGILLFQMHYTPNGMAQEDRSSVGLILTKEPPKYEVRTRGVMTSRFAIPPRDGNHEVQSKSAFSRDIQLLSFLPHMHLRGKDFKYEAVYADGRREVLLNVPRYDFGWQTIYRLADPLKLPAGTRIECTAHFDNSARNKNNPDPDKTVRWGDQTWEEMMIGFVDYVVLPEKK